MVNTSNDHLIAIKQKFLKLRGFKPGFTTNVGEITERVKYSKSCGMCRKRFKPGQKVICRKGQARMEVAFIELPVAYSIIMCEDCFKLYFKKKSKTANISKWKHRK